ncbi:hypothetical protein HPP92_002861 [Vanilla planifolia]|uniref:Uncharacterized protein n=1 Tax=Vanilla planifolia TaxID=51239 RepID=A0A835RTB5_VANPL|nr:hypothetical protein HPP92_002861 [Vanilla planifolia]
MESCGEESPECWWERRRGAGTLVPWSLSRPNELSSTISRSRGTEYPYEVFFSKEVESCLEWLIEGSNKLKEL